MGLCAEKVSGVRLKLEKEIERAQARRARVDVERLRGARGPGAAEEVLVVEVARRARRELLELEHEAPVSGGRELEERVDAAPDGVARHRVSLGVAVDDVGRLPDAGDDVVQRREELAER